MSKSADVEGIVARLSAHPRFAACTSQDLIGLAQDSSEASVPAAWPLIHELTPADACYVILDGELDVIVHGEPVARLGAGSVVGEVGLLTHHLRNATVVSRTPVDLLHIPSEAFDELMRTRPAIRAALSAQPTGTLN